MPGRLLAYRLIIADAVKPKNRRLCLSLCNHARLYACIITLQRFALKSILCSFSGIAILLFFSSQMAPACGAFIAVIGPMGRRDVNHLCTDCDIIGEVLGMVGKVQEVRELGDQGEGKPRPYQTRPGCASWRGSHRPCRALSYIVGGCLVVWTLARSPCRPGSENTPEVNANGDAPVGNTLGAGPHISQWWHEQRKLARGWQNNLSPASQLLW